MVQRVRARRAHLYGLTAAVCAGFIAAAPTLVHAQDRPLLVAIYKSGTQQYFIDQANGFKSKAAELGADAKTVNVELDANLALSELNNAIASGARGIGITVPDQQIGPAVSQVAQDAGIPLVATDDNIKDANGNDVPFVGFDGTDMGTKVGNSAASLLNNTGWIKDSSKKVGVLSVEVQTLSVCNDRTNASKQMVMQNAGVTAGQIFPVPYSGETDKALQAAGPVITAHPEVTNWAVFCLQ